ncbi:LOW QUALITY PROTEIN: C-type lectin domain family 2 member L-like [Mergus octosetaceus]
MTYKFSDFRVLVLQIYRCGNLHSEQCPSEIGYRKKCYFISEEEKNWTSSQAFCIKNESLLAIFENKGEMYSLVKLLRIDESWIGLCKKGERFYRENGTALNMNLSLNNTYQDTENTIKCLSK